MQECIAAFLKSGSLKKRAPYFSVTSKAKQQLGREIDAILHEAQALGVRYGQSMVEKQQESVLTSIKQLAGRAKKLVGMIINHVQESIAEAVHREQQAEPPASAEPTPQDEWALVQEQFKALETALPDLFASTEVHAAIEASVRQVLEGSGITLVAWRTEPDACDICVANEDHGPIEIGSAFPSGDAAPPQHPRCRCNVVPG